MADEYTLHGSPIRGLSNPELQNWIDRYIEQAADAMRYGGPNHARMYQDEVAKLMLERARRSRPPVLDFGEEWVGRP